VLQPIDGGREIPVEVFSRLMDDGARTETSGLTVLAVRDLRERRSAEEKIRYLAEHDGLTGLPNRNSLQARLAAAMDRVEASGESLSLICIDLDHFKEANDLHGHLAGDALLVETARRLQDSGAAPSFAARLGGDEFIVVQVAGGDQPGAAAELAGRLLEALPRRCLRWSGAGHGREPGRQPVPRRRPHGRGPDGQRRHGAVPRQGKRPRRLSLLQARDGRVDPRAPRPGARPEARHHRRGAGGPLPAPGPASDGEVCGFEALVRWNHPTRGMIPPLDFIPVAEENGLIAPLGEWVCAAPARRGVLGSRCASRSTCRRCS
jgi:diguanylate cyclase (GGDEF)-like protein